MQDVDWDDLRFFGERGWLKSAATEFEHEPFYRGHGAVDRPVEDFRGEVHDALDAGEARGVEQRRRVIDICGDFSCALLSSRVRSLRSGELMMRIRAAALVTFGTRCPREQGVGSRRRCATTAVWTGNDLQQVAVWVVEVEPAPTVPSVDLIALVAPGVGPVR
jgi:hypothetical protein